MATHVAAACEATKSIAISVYAIHKLTKWTATPLKPTRENITNRTGTIWPTNLSMMSNRYSHNTTESNLLSPAMRLRNVYGTSMKHRGVRDEANRSSRIL